MNDGVLKSVLIIVAGILIWSGWFDSFFFRHRLKKGPAYLFLLFFLFGQWQYMFNPHLSLNISGLVQAVILVGGIIHYARMKQVLLLSSALFLGSLLFLYYLVMVYDPIFRLTSETFVLPAAAALSSVILAGNLEDRLWISGASLLIANILFAWHQHHHLHSVTICSEMWQDQLWLGLYLAMFCHFIFNLAAKCIKKAFVLIKGNGLNRLKN